MTFQQITVDADATIGTASGLDELMADFKAAARQFEALVSNPGGTGITGQAQIALANKGSELGDVVTRYESQTEPKINSLRTLASTSLDTANEGAGALGGVDVVL